ncbi:MAG: hypothetical protein J6X46_07290 [Prevotella sp.]|nr:hypothetical protein [Prevotella sp.]
MNKIITMKQRFRHGFVWLKRIGHCRGFGIQSPTDYRLVRYVINEHWPYYQYETLGEGDEWLTRKLGLLYFRIANWRQPHMIESEGFQQYLQAGCWRAKFGDSTELIRLTLEGDYRSRLASIYNNVEENTVLIVEAIRKNRTFWREIVND